MRKIDPLFISGGLSVLLLIFRVVQLFLINGSGVVDPWWMILPVYLILAAITLLSFAFMKKEDIGEDNMNCLSDTPCRIILLVFSLLLFCEGLTSVLRYLAYDVITVAAISTCSAFIFLAIGFVLHIASLKKAAQVVTFVGFIEIIVYLVCMSIEIFVANGTSLAFNLNLLSLVGFVSQLFLFKALAREFTDTCTEKSRVSLKRSAFILVGILPSEIIGQILIHTGLLSEFPVEPIRNSYTEILVSVCLLVLAVFVLIAKKKPVEDIPTEE